MTNEKTNAAENRRTEIGYTGPEMVEVLALLRRYVTEDYDYDPDSPHSGFNLEKQARQVLRDYGMDTDAPPPSEDTPKPNREPAFSGVADNHAQSAVLTAAPDVEDERKAETASMIEDAMAKAIRTGRNQALKIVTEALHTEAQYRESCGEEPFYYMLESLRSGILGLQFQHDERSKMKENPDAAR